MQPIPERRKEVAALAEAIVKEQSAYSVDAIFILRAWGGPEHVPLLQNLIRTSKNKNLVKAAQLVLESMAKRKP
jgi:hypothetical protein